MARRGRLSGREIGVLLIDLGNECNREVKDIMRAGADTILADAKSRISGGGSGKLSASGKVEKIGRSGTAFRVVFDAVSEPSALGTNPGGYMYGRIVEHMAGHEHPFLYPAYDAHRDQIKQNVIDAIQKAVRAHAIT